MEILRRGENVAVQTCTWTCYACQSLIKARLDESGSARVLNPSDGTYQDFHAFVCPACDAQVGVSVDNIHEPSTKAVEVNDLQMQMNAVSNKPKAGNQ